MPIEPIQESLAQSAKVMQAVANDHALAEAIDRVARQCVETLQQGGKILFAGNGGSAADAQLLAALSCDEDPAAELVGRFGYDRPGLPAIALTTDTSALTAIGNDYGFDRIFARQVEALGKPGDVLFGFSTSGNSANILAAFDAAREANVVRVAMTGNRRGEICSQAEHVVEIPSDITAMIQQGHITVGHVICDLIEQTIYPRS